MQSNSAKLTEHLRELEQAKEMALYAVAARLRLGIAETPKDERAHQELDSQIEALRAQLLSEKLVARNSLKGSRP